MSSYCTRKAALSVFFGCQLVAFVFSLISLISPSWQYAYLENGRTEHHHGLWLDCKRDYSYDYGRTREYYETLYRRDLQGSPFDIFYLPPLQCVYKFDFYIDPEDLYDHNHDENRIQNDAYQHLFLGWKIAALAAVGVAVLLAGSALLLGICSYCHRTFICASTVLVTISAILSCIGLLVFYIWANYQDNKVIKEEDENIYEQYLGWAFWAQLVGAVLQWLASFLGCFATSVSFGKRRAKLVKIEINDGDDDLLLASNASSSTAPFKRSRSLVFQVDSADLRKSQRDMMNIIQQSQRDLSSRSTFQRTASMPNVQKRQKRGREIKGSHNDFTRSQEFTSSSNIHSAMTETTGTIDSRLRVSQQNLTASQPSLALPTAAKPALKSALKTPQSQRRELISQATSAYQRDDDSAYEYLPCGISAGVSSAGAVSENSPSRVAYDSVYECLPGENYMEPRSVTTRNENLRKALLPTLPTPHGSSQSIPAQTPHKSTLIDDVQIVRGSTQSIPAKATVIDDAGVPKTKEMLIMEQKQTELRRSQRYKKRGDDVPPPRVSAPAPPKKAMLPPANPLFARDIGIDPVNRAGYMQHISTETLVSSQLSRSPPRETVMPVETLLNTPGGTPRAQEPRASLLPREDDFPPPPPELGINVFGGGGDQKGSQRSIAGLSLRANQSVDVFDRPDSIASSDLLSGPPRRPAALLHRRLLASQPEEVDRSVGSSTILENDTMSEAASYARDAELRLNLFVNDRPGGARPANTSQDNSETTV